jgi:hypothetical protein
VAAMTFETDVCGEGDGSIKMGEVRRPLFDVSMLSKYEVIVLLSRPPRIAFLGMFTYVSVARASNGGGREDFAFSLFKGRWRQRLYYQDNGNAPTNLDRCGLSRCRYKTSYSAATIKSLNILIHRPNSV